jgi:hypothetical protein
MESTDLQVHFNEKIIETCKIHVNKSLNSYVNVETSRSESDKPIIDDLIAAIALMKLNTTEDLHELYNKSIFKKWIKLIPDEKTTLFEEYNRNEYFTLVADVILDNETKRNTVIQFVPKVSREDFSEKTEWLYLFTIDDRIVKIGGTRTGLKGRVASYLCGHHIKERGKTGDCSKTNAFIYNTFEFYLKLGCKIKMYGYRLPKTEITIDIFNVRTKLTAQTFHAYESTFLQDYKENYNKYPILSDNCDPEYRK